MSWVKLDDAAPDHPKWMELAEEPAVWAACWGLWVSCAAYCARQLTDGFVPRAYVTRATPLPNKAAIGAADALVRVGLWTKDDAGYRFHDWLSYNPSAEDVRAKREAAAKRMKGKRSAPETPACSRDVRENFARTEGELRAKFDDPVPDPIPLANTHPPGARAYMGQVDPAGERVEHQQRQTTADDLSRLYRHWRLVCERHAPAGAVPDPGELAGRSRVLEALNHPELRQKTAEQIERALDIVGVQCDEKHKAGEADPWGLLVSAWSPRVLAAALACPDEKTARQRAVRRVRGQPARQGRQQQLGSMPVRRAEEFADVTSK